MGVFVEAHYAISSPRICLSFTNKTSDLISKDKGIKHIKWRNYYNDQGLSPCFKTTGLKKPLAAVWKPLFDLIRKKSTKSRDLQDIMDKCLQGTCFLHC